MNELISINDIPKHTTLEQEKLAAAGRRENFVKAAEMKSDEIVLIPSGCEVPQPGHDQPHPYYPHPEHLYLLGSAKPGQILAFAPDEGWVLFTHIQTEDEIKWTGDTSTTDDVQYQTGIDRVYPLSELKNWLNGKKGANLAVLGHEDFAKKPADYELETPHGDIVYPFGFTKDAQLERRLRAIVSDLRTRRDDVELSRTMDAVRITQVAFNLVMNMTFTGKTELNIADALEAVMKANGMRRPSFPTIVGSGPHAAILHGEPTSRIISSNETVLIDAGVEARNGGISDLTRVIPALKFSPGQRDLYQVVLDAQEEAILNCRDGVDFRDVHMKTMKKIAEGLIQIGILKGNAEDRVADGSCALFFSHGLGHLVGENVHNLGKRYGPGREKSKQPGVDCLRADINLMARTVVTIEPGVYLAPWVLKNPKWRNKYKNVVNWRMVDELLETGSAGYGVRIEDMVAVASNGQPPIVLTHGIPKSVSEIEELRWDL
ncbi:MAG: aminopeptidase P N-terminal domain-containing protein [Candidatus Gracilibacteria bacterium]